MGSGLGARAGFFRGLAILAALLPLAAGALAQEFEPLPSDASVQKVLHLEKRNIPYVMTGGTIPVRDDKARVIAQVVYTAYSLQRRPGEERPVSFVFNGGPGAAAVFLNLGALGPQRVQFGAAGGGASDVPRLQDNPYSWLPFTDLVFVDPVGTGYSRPFVSPEEAAKLFWNDQKDPEYLARFVFDWLKVKGRLRSPVYLVGESHSGYRLPKMARILQQNVGLGLNGMVLVSPILDTAQKFKSDLSPLPWMVNLPSMAAAHLDRLGKLSPEAMRPVIDYARGDYMVGLVRGRSDPAALDRMVERVSAFTGLDPAYVRRSGARIDADDYVRELYRTEGRMGSTSDPQVTSSDPFPFAVKAEDDYTAMGAIISPTASAMTDLYRRELGWKVDRPYVALSIDANAAWNGGKWGQFESFSAVRDALATHPEFRVMIAHGWADLSCPFLASELLVESLPRTIASSRIQVRKYPGGHMFYTRPTSAQQFYDDAAAFYAGS